MKDLREKSIKSVMWVGSTRLFGQFLSWGVTLLLVRLLSPSDFGLMGMVMSYQMIIILIYDLSLGEAIIQKEELSDEDTSTCFWFTLGFGLFLTALTWVLAPAISSFFRESQLTAMLRVSSLGVLCLAAREIHNVLLSRQLDFEKRSKAQLFAGIAQLGVSLVLALLGFGVWSLVYGLLANNFSHAVLVISYQKWRPKLYFSWDRLVSMFRFAGPLVGSNLIWYVTNSADSVVVGRVLGAVSLGYYRVAMDFSRIPIDKFIKIIQEVCFPVFSKLQNDKDGLAKYFLKVTKYIALFSMPVFAGMALLSNEIIDLILTPKWRPARGLLVVFCVLSIYRSFVGVFMALMKAIGRVDILFRYSVLCAVLLPVTFLVAVQYNVMAVAVSWLVVFPLMFFYLLGKIALELEIKVFDFVRNMHAEIIATVVMSGAVMSVKTVAYKDSVSWESLSVCVAVGVFMYMGTFAVFSPETYRDFMGIVKIGFSGDKSS